jgi:hypothetical protein
MDPPQIRQPETRRHFLKAKVDLKVKLNIISSTISSSFLEQRS